VKRIGRGPFAAAGVAACAVIAAIALSITQTDNTIPDAPAALRPVLPRVARYVESRWRGPQGHMFCEVRYLGNSPPGNRFSLYVWEACQQYQVADGHLVRHTGWSSAAVATVAATPDGYRVIDEQEPVDYNDPQFSHMFPSGRVRHAIWSLDGSTSTGPGTPAAMFAADARRARRLLLHQ
jgi:hypothetical protein